MALCRIKNPQQLQLYKAGEMGKLLGYDRIADNVVYLSKNRVKISQKNV
jgi:hypothetical protein